MWTRAWLPSPSRSTHSATLISGCQRGEPSTSAATSKTVSIGAAISMLAVPSIVPMLSSDRGQGVLADQLGGALGLLPPEHVADALERLEASAGDQGGDLASVGIAEQAIGVAVDHQRRQRDLAEALVGVVGGAGLHLLQDHRLRRGQRRSHLGEGGEARVVLAEAGGEVDLPHRPED